MKCTGDDAIFNPEPRHEAALLLPELPGDLTTQFQMSSDLTSVRFLVRDAATSNWHISSAVAPVAATEVTYLSDADITWGALSAGDNTAMNDGAAGSAAFAAISVPATTSLLGGLNIAAGGVYGNVD